MASRTSSDSIVLYDVIDPNDGLSAFQIAQQNGFIGTEAEWLASLEGSNGVNGYNNGVARVFLRSNNQPSSAPTVNGIYDFDTALVTFNGNPSSNGWSNTVPVGTDPVWTRVEAVSSRQNTTIVETTGWSDPVQLGADPTDGQDGFSTGLAQIWIETSEEATAPELPTDDVTFIFADGRIDSNPNGGWSRFLPSGQPGTLIWTSVAAAASRGPTDIIEANEWDNPVVYTYIPRDGAQSPRSTQRTVYFGPSADMPSAPTALSINFVNGMVSALTSGWSLNPPSASAIGTNDVYWSSVITFTEISFGSTQSVSSTSPTPIQVYGSDIQSDNYMPGAAGWRIARDSGNAEFNDGTFRGTLGAGIVSAENIEAHSITADEIDVNSIGAAVVTADRVNALGISAQQLQVGSISNTNGSAPTGNQQGANFNLDGSFTIGNNDTFIRKTSSGDVTLGGELVTEDNVAAGLLINSTSSTNTSQVYTSGNYPAYLVISGVATVDATPNSNNGRVSANASVLGATNSVTFNTGWDDIIDTFDETNEGFNDISTVLDEVEDAMDEVATSLLDSSEGFDNVSTSLSSQVDGFEALETAFDALRGNFAGASSNINNAGNSLDSAADGIEAAANAVGDVSDALGNAASAASGVAGDLDEAGEAFVDGAVNGAQEAAGYRLRNAAQAMSALADRLADASSAVTNLSGGLDTASFQIGSASSHLTATSSSLNDATTSVTSARNQMDSIASSIGSSQSAVDGSATSLSNASDAVESVANAISSAADSFDNINVGVNAPTVSVTIPVSTVVPVNANQTTLISWSSNGSIRAVNWSLIEIKRSV